MSRSIRRNIDGVIAENQGKARGAGELRVTLFPSKHSRVRPPGPRARKSRHPLSKPETRASGLPLEAGWLKVTCHLGKDSRAKTSSPAIPPVLS
jgi:hypothetical protein